MLRLCAILVSVGPDALVMEAEALITACEGTVRQEPEISVISIFSRLLVQFKSWAIFSPKNLPRTYIPISLSI